MKTLLDHVHAVIDEVAGLSLQHQQAVLEAAGLLIRLSSESGKPERAAAARRAAKGQLLTTAQVAKATGLNPANIVYHAKAKNLPVADRKGRAMLFDPAAVEAFMAQRRS